MANVRRSTIQKQMPDDLLEQYGVMLLDEKRITLEEIRDWLAEQGIKASVSMVHRDRKAELACRDMIAAKANLAGYMAREAARTGVSTAELNVEIAGQMIFDCLNGLDVATLQPETAGQMIRLLEATAHLRGVESRAKLVDLQREQVAKAVADAKAEAAKRAEAADGKVDVSDVYELLDNVMKGQA